MGLDLLFDGPEDAPVTLALAHGAGAGMDHPFLESVAAGLGERGVRVARFEFPYMARRRAAKAAGEKPRGGPPDRPAVLEATWREVIAELEPGARRLAIGGKSMGGRIATMVAAEGSGGEGAGAQIDAVVCLGYPFHPPGRPEKLRTAHLENLAVPTLILQGTRDPFGGRDEVPGYALSDAVEVRWLEDGDHSLKPRKASGRAAEENLAEAISRAAEFLGRLGGAGGG